jgi:hypothetical protein
MAEDTPHNPTWRTSKGNPSATVWVRAALHLELVLVSLAACLSQMPLTTMETPATIKVCGTCLCASSMTVVNAAPFQALIPVEILAAALMVAFELLPFCSDRTWT